MVTKNPKNSANLRGPIFEGLTAEFLPLLRDQNHVGLPGNPNVVNSGRDVLLCERRDRKVKIMGFGRRTNDIWSNGHCEGFHMLEVKCV